jgi:hypothetical protein
MTVEHQFLNTPYFFPNWEVDTIFLGTFNPICGESLDYYYRRSSNGFWKIMKRYNSKKYSDFPDFEGLMEFMTFKRFGCVDVIRKVTFPDFDKIKICGKGYSDGNLFTVKNYMREYNFERIKNFLNERKIINVFSTWGYRTQPNEFLYLVTDFKRYCSQNGVRFTELMSPSGRVYRGNNVNDINRSWWEKLDPIFNNH